MGWQLTRFYTLHDLAATNFPSQISACAHVVIWLTEYCSFPLQLQRIDRLKGRLTVMIFMGNFEEDIAMLVPVRF